MAACLVGVFLSGVWLGWRDPGALPVGLGLVAVSLDGEPLADPDLTRMPTLVIARRPVPRFQVRGTTGCNAWTGDLELTTAGHVSLSNTFVTATACGVHLMETEKRFMDALRGAVRWRREGGSLILESESHAIRFLRAPR